MPWDVHQCSFTEQFACIFQPAVVFLHFPVTDLYADAPELAMSLLICLLDSNVAGAVHLSRATNLPPFPHTAPRHPAAMRADAEHVHSPDTFSCLPACHLPH